MANQEAGSTGSAKENACKHGVHTASRACKKRGRKRDGGRKQEKEKERKQERERENKKKDKEKEKETEKEKEKEGGETEWPRISRLLCRWDRKALASMRAPAQTSICGSLVKEGKAAQASAGTILPT